MPNTLAHIAVQGVGNVSWRFGRYVPWILLGAVLPDVPWIASRALRFLNPEIDEVTLELYCVVQASWLFSVLLGVAFAAFAKRPVAVALLLAANTLLHLLLDAVEIKPGSGVHLLAPFSWRTTSFAWAWPEHPAVTAVSLLGAAIGIWFLVSPRFRPPADERLVFEAQRFGVAAGAVAVYLALPLTLVDGPWDADYRSVRSLVTSEISVRNRVELERDPVVRRENLTFVRTFGREYRLIAEDELPDGAVVSVVGYLSAPATIRATEVHVNATGFRDAASAAGLAIVAAVWLRLLAESLRRPGSALARRRSG